MFDINGWTWAGAALIVASASGFVALFVGAAYSALSFAEGYMTLLGALFVSLGALGGYCLWYGQS